MRLTINAEAMARINEIRTSNDKLILDLDDGIGAFSKLLMENGLKYQLLVVRADLVPAGFEKKLDSTVGPIFFNRDTEWYLDSEMRIDFKANTDSYRLWSTNGLLEPQLPIKRMVPIETAEMEF
ncbi:iron-sulfur cluster biosynthesis family protein [Companilactobacillus kimchiensis]|nr:iron-sulfur cluster biosynthesis family protein [Companilactobacillus kimchiensis]